MRVIMLDAVAFWRISPDCIFGIHIQFSAVSDLINNISDLLIFYNKMPKQENPVLVITNGMKLGRHVRVKKVLHSVELQLFNSNKKKKKKNCQPIKIF